MPCHASHAPGSRIMHDAPQHSTVLVIFGRSDFRAPGRIRQETRAQHLQRRKDVRLGVLVQRHPGNTFHQGAQDNEICVAVDETRTRRLLRGLLKRHAVRGLLALPRRLQIYVRRQTRVMGKQLPYRDVFFSVLPKLGNVLHDIVVEPHFAPFKQLHDRSGCRDDLGQRRDIKYRVHCHQFPAGLK